MPFAQTVQDAAPAPEYLPTPQALQDHLPVLPWYLPEAQLVHVLAPAEEYLPLPQVEQEVALSPESLPLGQVAQDPVVT